ncbi:MAG: UvrD-helicase domain-containing protein [Acidimicrobiales bacterium]
MSEVTFDDLIPAQQDVADQTRPTALVLGGAGVGKTTTALWAARRELTDHGHRIRPAPDHRSLFVTFSRTAVAQIRRRAGGVLTGIADAVEILTFHGLAYRLLCAFGSFVGIDGTPTLAGEARGRLVEPDEAETQLTYNDLIPGALRLLETPGPIAEIVKARWSLVICDEFQDTDEEEWKLLQILGSKARLLLLADPNQMIYTFKDGVSEARLDAARARPGFVEHTLPPGSHRDPTQVLPDAAVDVRWRRFDAPAVRRAVEDSRLVVYAHVSDGDDDRAESIGAEVARLRGMGHATIGIYAKTNNDAAGLSAALTEIGVEHVPIGFSEAYGESVSAMVDMVRYARGDAEWVDVRTALGVTLTASVRGSKAPPLAVAIRDDEGLPGQLELRLQSLRGDLDAAGDDLGRATIAATCSWQLLSLASGRRAWSRAARTFTSLSARSQRLGADPVGNLVSAAQGMRNASFVELDSGDSGAIQLMNFHQTKGREADAVILSFSSADYYGRGGEPYDEASRVLYVSMTRARRRVLVMLPSDPHPLVAPFGQYAVAVSE